MGQTLYTGFPLDTAMNPADKQTAKIALTSKAKPMQEPPFHTATDTGHQATKEWSALLIQVARENDRGAFRQLYQYFGPRIKAYAINQGFSQQAEVLVQEVMVRIWRNASSYNPQVASASTWIFTIARNQRIDMLRRLSRQSAEIKLEVEELWQIPSEEDPTILSIQSHSREEYIRQSLAKLPEEQMIALRKVYYEGKTHEQVAEELQIPLGTIKGRIRLALQKLRVMFEAKDL